MQLPALYATALANLSKKQGVQPAALVGSLTKHLQAKGRMKLLPGIVRELHTQEARAASMAPSVEVASLAEEKSALAQARAAGIQVDAAVINTTLIRGWRGRAGDILVDRSAKSALVAMYRKIVQ